MHRPLVAGNGRAASGSPIILLILVGAALATAMAAQPRALIRGSSVLLHGCDRADQVIAFKGGFLVRSSDFARALTQSIRLFDRSGRLVRAIGGYGPGPYQYDRLMAIALDAKDMLWAAELQSKVIRYSLRGDGLGTLLIQSPGYEVEALALGARHKYLYLAGCQPLHYYLDMGCLLVHQYDAATGLFLRSFLDTPAGLLRAHLFPLEAYALAVGPGGNIFFADAPVFRIWSLNPVTGKIQSFQLNTRATAPRPLLTGQGADYYQRAYDDSFLVQKLLVSGSYVLVAIRKPHNAGYLIQILTLHGRQVASDLELPGVPVGNALGGFYFARSERGGMELTLYRVGSQ